MVSVEQSYPFDKSYESFTAELTIKKGIQIEERLAYLASYQPSAHYRPVLRQLPFIIDRSPQIRLGNRFTVYRPEPGERIWLILKVKGEIPRNADDYEIRLTNPKESKMKTSRSAFTVALILLASQVYGGDFTGQMFNLNGTLINNGEEIIARAVTQGGEILDEDISVDGNYALSVNGADSRIDPEDKTINLEFRRAGEVTRQVPLFAASAASSCRCNRAASSAALSHAMPATAVPDLPTPVEPTERALLKNTRLSSVSGRNA